jgi:hypothetical protein
MPMRRLRVTKREVYYKVLGEGGQPYHGGSGVWSLPTLNEQTGEWTPGEWMPPIEGALVPCRNGYHLANLRDLPQWFGPRIFVAEYKGRRVDADDKSVVRNVRLVRETGWNERTARLFAVDCVEHALDNMKEPPLDADKLREVLAVCRRFADGQATQQELTAARDAAWAAAWDAARDAAWDAAWAAAWDAARDAAWDAARDAAWAAAWAAARAAARDAEIEWQRGRLLQYLDGRLK